MAFFKKFVKKLKKILKDNRGASKSKSKKKSKPQKKAVSKKKKKAVKAKKTSKTKSKKKTKKVSKKAAKKAPSVPSNYERVGIITHYFPHVKAGVIKIAKGKLATGDQIHIKGATTDIKQTVASLQIDHVTVQSVKKGDDAGLQTKDKVRANDVVYRVR